MTRAIGTMGEGTALPEPVLRVSSTCAMSVEQSARPLPPPASPIELMSDGTAEHELMRRVSSLYVRDGGPQRP